MGCCGGPSRTTSSPGSLRREMREQCRQWATAQRRLVVLAAELDHSGEWALDGAATCAHWLAEALDVEVCTSREWLRIGHALEQLPAIAGAFASGHVSYSKVRALTRVATTATEAELLAVAASVPAGRLGATLATWLQRRERPEDTEARHQGARSFRWWTEADGMVVGSFRLPPYQAATVTTPVELAVRRGDFRPRPNRAGRSAGPPRVAHSRTEGGENASAGASGPLAARWPSLAQQRADALVALLRGGGANLGTEIVLHVRGDGCSLDDGTPVAETVVARLAPTSFLRALVHDARSRPTDASGRRRHPSARQRRVVTERDRACVDCGATEHLEADHVPGWATTRRTRVEELVLRCWACHRARHKREPAVSR